MIAGTYVLTDTIDRSFDEIFTESNEGIDAVVSTKEVVEFDDGSLPPVRRFAARRGAQDAGRRGGGGLHRRHGRGDHRGGRGARRGGRGAEPRLLCGPGALRPADLRRGRPAAVRRRGRDRLRHGRERGLRGGRPGDPLRPRRDPRLHDLRARQARRRRIAGRRHVRGPHPRGGAADHRQAGQVRRGQRGGGAGDEPRPARGEPRGGPARRRQDGDRRGEHRGAEAGHRRGHRLPPDRAADLRRGRAFRRLLPDLQHVLDHGRPAHPRVRDAAHARRQPRGS